MLTLSRDALLKMGRHSWNVYPFEAFGFLIGTSLPMEVYAALPCSRSYDRWTYSDRWNSIDEKTSIAKQIAQRFGLELIGLYGSDEPDIKNYPIPSTITETTLKLLLIYYPVCCPSHSGIRLHLGEEKLSWQDYRIPPGKRPARELSQKRIYRAWRNAFGVVDYTNTETNPPSFYGL